MMKCIHMKGFRSFADYTVKDLARVNLLVGANNCGKTSVLEAVELLARGVWDLQDVLEGRGECEYPSGSDANIHLDARSLFNDFRIDPGQHFSLSDCSGSARFRAMVEVDTENNGGEFPGFPRNGEGGGSDNYFLRLKCEYHINRDETWICRLTESGFFNPNKGIWPTGINPEKSAPCHVIQAGVSNIFSMYRAWTDTQLTPKEENVTRAIRILEPKVDRIAAAVQLSTGGRAIPPSFIVKLKDRTDPVRLGSLGGGMRHMLGLALGLVQSAKGFLLVDEIDTGLHYSAMVPMWKMVIETAKQLDVQVFATTHSEDCIHALGKLHEADLDSELTKDVRVHRLDRDIDHSTSFTAEEMGFARDAFVEVR